MKKKLSLRLQILFILGIFMVLVLGLVYFFQAFLLDDFYKANKISYLKSTADNIGENIQNEDLPDVLDNITFSNEVCVRIVTDSFGIVGYKEDSACALGRLSEDDVNKIYAETSKNGGEKLFDNLFFQFGSTFVQNIYLYSKIVHTTSEDILVMTSTNIVPLTVTVNTISDQYKVIIAIVILATIILAFVLSAIILKPINRIETESKNLPKGKYDRDNVKTSSLEIENLNDTLGDANEEIKKADKARKELIGNVSHDLRTPLTMIVGYGEMMKDLPEENNEDNINVIIDEAKRLSTLVDDLLDLSKIESGETILNKEDISINELLKSVFRQYEAFCKSQGVEFRLELVDDVVIKADKKRLEQVLYNFINNALNYNDKENKEVVLGSELVNGIHRVYVYDNGRGIEESDLNKIWDRYYKVDKEHKRAHLGSGIGLSLSRDLLIASGFKYGVESKINEYSKFYFDVDVNDK